LDALVLKVHDAVSKATNRAARFVNRWLTMIHHAADLCTFQMGVAIKNSTLVNTKLFSQQMAIQMRRQDQETS